MHSLKDHTRSSAEVMLHPQACRLVASATGESVALLAHI